MGRLEAFQPLDCPSANALGLIARNLSGWPENHRKTVDMLAIDCAMRSISTANHKPL
jgi:hypothetical protein